MVLHLFCQKEGPSQIASFCSLESDFLHQGYSQLGVSDEAHLKADGFPLCFHPILISDFLLWKSLIHQLSLTFPRQAHQSSISYACNFTNNFPINSSLLFIASYSKYWPSCDHKRRKVLQWRYTTRNRQLNTKNGCKDSILTRLFLQRF